MMVPLLYSFLHFTWPVRLSIVRSLPGQAEYGFNSYHMPPIEAASSLRFHYAYATVMRGRLRYDIYQAFALQFYCRMISLQT